jgi:hypothetical protein
MRTTVDLERSVNKKNGRKAEFQPAEDEGTSQAEAHEGRTIDAS